MSDHDRPAVEVADVEKRFGATRAVAGVSFTIGSPEIFGLIGPDGAGKTTLFRIMTTLIVPDRGRARVLGRDTVSDLWALRPLVGYMPGRFSLYPDLTVAENLDFFASVFGTTPARERARIAPIYDQLAPFADRRAAALSGGMKQKLALCCALVHRPAILFLDEPTTGVDAVSRREFWDLLGDLKASGLTIVVSTPYMDEATRCDRIALMQRGAILGIDTPAGIVRAFDRPLFAVGAGAATAPGAYRYRALLALREFAHAAAVYPFGEVLHYVDARRDAPRASIAAELRAFLAARGFGEAVVAAAPPTVEDTFIARMADAGRPAA
jgi:ABC-2 type transport system ATP-binding protein